MLHPTKKENGEIEDVSCIKALLHFLSIGWKVLFSVITPPPNCLGGYATFILALAWIGFVVYVVAEVANLFGCITGFKNGFTAITFVAIGTSLPDTFASRTAAVNSKYADEAVGNITGSNCVNVFLGLGAPWLIATIYNGNSADCKKCTGGIEELKVKNGLTQQQAVWECLPFCGHKVGAKGLTMSVILFLSTSTVGFIILILRRVFVKGELGGPSCSRYSTAFAFVFLWIVYVTIAGMDVYGVFETAKAPVPLTFAGLENGMKPAGST